MGPLSELILNGAATEITADAFFKRSYPAILKSAAANKEKGTIIGNNDYWNNGAMIRFRERWWYGGAEASEK